MAATLKLVEDIVADNTRKVVFFLSLDLKSRRSQPSDKLAWIGQLNPHIPH